MVRVCAWGRCHWRGDIWTVKFAVGDNCKMMYCSKQGAAYVSIGRIHSLYRVSLLGMDNVESRARRGKSLRKIPVALCMTEVRCLVNRSLESRRRPGYRTCVFHGISVRWKWRGAGGIFKPYMLTSVSDTSVYLSLATSLTTVLSYCFAGITQRCVHIWNSVCRFRNRRQHDLYRQNNSLFYLLFSYCCVSKP